MIKTFLELSRKNKQMVLLVADLFNLYIAIYWSFVFRFNSFTPFQYLPNSDFLIPFLFPIITIPFFVRTGLYRAVLKHMGLRTILAAIYSISIATIILITAIAFYKMQFFYLESMFAINWFISISFTLFMRYLAYWVLYADNSRNMKKCPSIAIYGSGDAGIKLADSILIGDRFRLEAMIDDDDAKVGTIVKSIRVYSSKNIESLINNNKLDMILLAIPSLGKRHRKQILNKLSKFPIKVMELPSIENIIDGNVTIDDIKNVEVEDILSRDPIKPIADLLDKNIKNKSILITGAGGSIGSELSRQVYLLSPKVLVLYELSEFNLYSIHQELEKMREKVTIVPILGSIQHKLRIRNIYKKYKIQTVYHAAAYKHVPMVEFNPSAGAYNNIIGTYNVAKEAQEANVETFVFISTDKAVRPTNIMGATKRFSEMILKMLNDEGAGNTIFSMVRFGNVLDSAGSVLPLFRKQIREGGPVTVTHKEIIRYFMSIPEAVQLVIQSGAMAKGGEVFLLDMGDPVNILEMAKKMIHLSGLTPIDESNKNGDIEIKITGLRPGEKLYEELLIDNQPLKTIHGRIMKANEESIPYDLIREGIDKFKVGCKKQDNKMIKDLLIKYINGYKPEDNA